MECLEPGAADGETPRVQPTVTNRKNLGGHKESNISVSRPVGHHAPLRGTGSRSAFYVMLESVRPDSRRCSRIAFGTSGKAARCRTPAGPRFRVRECRFRIRSVASCRRRISFTEAVSSFPLRRRHLRAALPPCIRPPVRCCAPAASSAAHLFERHGMRACPSIPVVSVHSGPWLIGELIAYPDPHGCR